MSTVFEPKDLPAIEKNGASINMLANTSMLGTNALQVEHIALETSAKSSKFETMDSERFVYVIRGKGEAYVGEQAFSLDAETVLWLEKTEVFYLEAGMDGLEVLLCHAPASD